MTKIHRQQYGWLAVLSSFVTTIAASGQNSGSQVTEVAVPSQEGARHSTVNRTTNHHVVTDWNSAALNAIRAGRTPAPIASRSLAILHAAIYDAINGMEFDLGHQFLLVSHVPATQSHLQKRSLR